MKLKYAKPQRLNAEILTFVADNEAIKVGLASGELKALSIHDLFASYRAKENIEWYGDICIPKTRWGNLGKHNDMVYFGTGSYPEEPGTYTVAIMIEILLMHPEAFEPAFLTPKRADDIIAQFELRI